jgi:hypothetical protein
LDRNSSVAISGYDRCVASSGRIRSSAAVKAEGPGTLGPRSSESRARSARASPVRVPRSGRRLSSSRAGFLRGAEHTVCHRLPSRAYVQEAESGPAKPAKPAACLLTCEKSAPRGKNQTPRRETDNPQTPQCCGV